jgi:hypothetical protein
MLNLNYECNGLRPFWDNLLYIVTDIFPVLLTSNVFSLDQKYIAVLKKINQPFKLELVSSSPSCCPHDKLNLHTQSLPKIMRPML